MDYHCTTVVAGLHATPGYQEVKDYLQSGDKLLLRREPKNEFDKDAVAVHTEDGAKIGYIPRAVNQLVGAAMTIYNNREIFVSEHNRKKDYKTRLTIDIHCFDVGDEEESDDDAEA